MKRLLTMWKRKLRPRRRRAKADPVLTGGAIVDHSSVRAADPYAFEAAHRRLAWMLRLVSMICVGLFLVVVVQTAAISELVPLQKVQLGLVRIEERTGQSAPVDPASLVRVIPVTREVEGYDLLMEAFARRYVRVLLEIDSVSQGDRMREANLHSDAEWWKKFTTERKKEIEAAIDSGLSRSVVVESADRISIKDGLAKYAVDLVQIDRRAGKDVETRKLRAYLAVVTRPHTVRPSEKFENPLGIRVLDVALKERGNS